MGQLHSFFSPRVISIFAGGPAFSNRRGPPALWQGRAPKRLFLFFILLIFYSTYFCYGDFVLFWRVRAARALAIGVPGLVPAPLGGASSGRCPGVRNRCGGAAGQRGDAKQ